MTWLRIALALPLGLVFGSFLTVVVHRVPAGESIVAPRSKCPACGTQLRAIDNVPVLSWLLLRGRCRTCGARISPVYPVLELGTGLLFVAVALRVDEVWAVLILCPFSALLVAIAVIDWRTKKIPNRIVYPALAIAAVYLAAARIATDSVHLRQSAAGFLAYGGGLLVVALVVPRGMGMGDVKLAALMGMVLGAIGIRFVAVAAGAGILLGGVGALVALLLGASRKSAIPFGPFLAAGAVVAVLFGSQLADAYLRLMT